MARKRKRSIFFWIFKMPLLLLAVAVIGCNLWVVVSTNDRIFASVDRIEMNEVGIVLGTSKKIGPEQPNLHFENRLKAAAELFHAGKIRHLLVSGHRDSRYYDETRDMTEKLHSLGVPSSAITPDNAGHRTLDSIARAKRVFGLNSATVISDDFHVSRALFIADREGLDAIAFRSESVGIRMSVRARAREYLARVKAVLDLYFLNTEPADTGESKEILVRLQD